MRKKIKIPEWVKEETRRLRENGYWFWTTGISSTPAHGPLVKNLKSSRSAFISVLAQSEPDNLIRNLLNPSPPLTRKLMVKHAMVATDASAEILDRAKSYIAFKKIRVLHAQIKGRDIEYQIKRLGTSYVKRLTNEEISSAGEALLSDLFFIICFGSSTKEFLDFLSFKSFRLAELCGDSEAIQAYFQELYIDISRQLTQLAVQAKGEFLNDYVRSNLDARFKGNPSIKWVENRRVPGIGDERALSLGGEQFDLVYAIQRTSGHKTTYVAVEVAFQETTNSVMERKARQASLLFRLFNEVGYKLCFVVDGAGFLSARPKALRDIIHNSHIRVTLKTEELSRLCEFIISLAKQS